MRKQALAVIVLCCLSMFAAAQIDNPGYQDGAIWLKLKPAEELLVKKKTKPSVDDIPVLKPLKEKYKLRNLEKPFKKIRTASPLQNTFLLTFDEIHEADKLVKELERSGVLEYAEKVPLNKVSATPNDQYLTTQWHLNTINAQGAWNIHADGSNTIIAIVDDGVNLTHPDLAPNIWINSKEIPANGIDDDNNGYVDDVKGWDFGNNDNDPNVTSSDFFHGTHVAGIASAATNNNLGIASIGYSAKIMCIKTAYISRTITFGYEGIVYAADNGANIINASWGGNYSSVTGQNVINYAISKGCIVVAAAGNNGVESVLYPAAFPGVVSVAATNSSDAKAGFSNYGNAITISAPGENIYSTLVGGGYGYMSGTSMASPLVAGLLASMHAYNPWMPNTDLVNCLKFSATNIYALNPAYIGKLGAGRINAAAAMQCVGSYLQTPPTADFSASNTVIDEGATVLFKNLSTYATSWAWSFEGGSPDVSTEKEPAIRFNTPGTYKVTLTATNIYGFKKETKANYITVNNGTGCQMVNYPVPTTWIADKMLTSGGWVNGTNAYKDRQKAMYFDASTTAGTFMTRVLIKFAAASAQDLNKKVYVRIYDGTSGIPTNLLRTDSLTMSTIMDDVINDRYTTVIFKQPVALPVSKRYFVSVDVSNLYGNTSTDPIVIWSNQNGQTIPNATWEQWSDRTWHAYNAPECWVLSMSLYIHPFLTNEPAIATFASTATTICADGTVLFDATGSTDPANLEWAFESGNPASATNVLTQSVTFNTPGPHQVKLTVSGGGCNEIRDSTTIINVNENVTPSLILTSNTDAPDMPVTFTATPTYGGQDPVFTFKKNGGSVQSGSAGTWSSTNLRSGDVVSCTMQSNYSCVTTAIANSNSITISESTISITVLPVQLIYFKGSSVFGAHLLQWASATENNTDKYIVEYSTDRTRFSAVGTVKAKGESNAAEAYLFQDTRTTPAYYRLRMVDKDGSFKFSQVIYLGGNKSSGLVLWPNPAAIGQEVQLALTVGNAKQQTVQILDAFGKVMTKVVVPVRNGKLETAIPTQSLFPGIYFITISDELTGIVQKEKLVIVK